MFMPKRTRGWGILVFCLVAIMLMSSLAWAQRDPFDQPDYIENITASTWDENNEMLSYGSTSYDAAGNITDSYSTTGSGTGEPVEMMVCQTYASGTMVYTMVSLR